MHGSLQQDGGGGAEGGGAVDCRGEKKEQVSLERKGKKKNGERIIFMLFIAQSSKEHLY